jgi:uncharacterized protein YndB with AHSA1/START domain
MDLGTFVTVNGRPAVRFRRSYDHPAERVWTALTDPGELPHWFPSTVAMQPHAGGTIEFSGDPNMPLSTGTILEFQPPRRLAYTWGSTELHFELEAAGESGCVLTLINVLEARDEAARNAAGWSVCLAELDKLLADAVADGPHADAAAQSWRGYYDTYIAAGLPYGAGIPSDG